MISLPTSPDGCPSRRSVLRALVALAVVVIGAFAWVALATGAQPYETYEEAVGSDGPVAQFRFNDASASKTLEDSVGAYTATNTGITLAGEGPFGGTKSGAFGGEAYASLPASPLSGASAFTVEGWVYWTGGASYEQAIFDFGSSTTNYMFLTPAGGSKHLLLFELRTSAGTDVQVTAPKLTAKKWEYVAVTETSSGTLTLYVNGEQVGQTTGATLFPSSLGSVAEDYLGKSQVASAPLFNGNMSNVAFYTKALSAERVKAHYDAGEYPVNTVLPTISGTAKDGSTLTATKGTWTGLTPITYAYQWLLCNAAGEGCANIPSGIETKYVLGHEDVGDTLRVAVSGANSAGTSTARSAQTAVVAPLAPSNTVLPAISGTTEQGQLLSVNNGTWGGTPPFSYTYKWETCNSAGEKCKTITGATASIYRVLGSQIGETLRAIVTAENAAGSKSATSAPTAVITTGPPVNIALPTISGEAKEAKTLSASTGTWAGTEPLSYSYQWQLCNSSGESCANISGATGSSYTLGSSDVGGTMRMVVTAKNSVGSASTASQASSIVVGPPLSTTPPVISGIPRDGQPLTASAGGWSGYPALSYAYQWERCNSSGERCSNVSGATGSPYTVSHSDVGTTLRVNVTATNPLGSTTATSAATGVITALAPSNTADPTISGEAKQGETLTASTGEWEGTPPLTYSYQWESCNTLGEGCLAITGATSSSYTLGASEIGMTMRVVVTATNAGGSAAASSTPSSLVIAGSSCTDTWTGANTGGTWQTASNWSSGAAPTTSDVACVPAGDTVNITEGSQHAGRISGEGSLAITGGSLELTGSSQPSKLGSLSLSSGTLTGTDTLDLTGSFTLQGYGAITGSGSLVIQPGAKGVINASSGCEPMTLSGRTLVNEGSLDYIWGTLEMSEGATLENTGTLEYNTRSSCYEPQIRLASESTNAQILNTGTFERTSTGTGGVGVPFTNDGAVEAQSGRLAFSDGGVPEEVADGSWTVASGGSIALTGGTFKISESVDLSAVTDEGATIELVGGSGPPVLSTAPLISGETSVGHTLTASTGRWKGKGPLSYTYQWQRCNAAGEACKELSGATSSSYTLTAADAGSTLRVTVTASNPEGEASATSQPTNSIAFPPINTSPPTVSGTAQGGQTLTASTGSWEGASPISYSYQWQSCSEGGGIIDSALSPAFATPLALGGGGGGRRNCTDIEGANAATYTLQSSDVETTVRVVVTAKNSYSETTANSTESPAVIPAMAPKNTGLPSIYGTAQEGQTLEAGEGNWQSEGKTTYTYQWQHCNANGEACTNIEGATQATYVPGIPDLAATLRVTVTASNGAGSASATSEPTEAVTQAPPPVTKEAPAISGAPKDGRTLTAGTGSWETPFPLTYTYQWQRCSTDNLETCANISGATSATYTVTSADAPDSYVRVSVTATNIYEASSSSTSLLRLIPRSVRVTEYSYEADGDLASVTDGNGQTTSYEYGPGNEQTKVTQPNGDVSEIGYNADGQMTSQTDGDKHTTTYERNVLGEVTEVTDPLGRKTTEQYDPAGNRTSVTDAAKRTTTYHYDAANQLTEVNYSDGTTPTVKYEYDADRNRTKMTDGTGTSTYNYDQLDQLTETTDGHGDSVHYGYNLAGEQTNITYPGGKGVQRSYDNDGRLSSVKDWLGNLTSFTYDPDSNLTGITFPETTGDTDHYAYNNAAEMTEADFTRGSETLASLSYARDNEGQVTQATSKGLPGEEAIGYDYDQNNRLMKAGTTTYRYDAAGNPTEIGPTAYVYDAADQLERSGNTSYTYDEVGERTKATPASGPATSYVYDQAGNLISVSRPEEGATTKIEDSYGYNGEGLRTSQTTSGITSHPTWDVTESVPLLLADNTYSYIYGPSGLPIEQVNDTTGTVFYLHHDQQGSTRLITGSSGTAEGKCIYSAYGTPTCEGTASSPLGYDAQYTSPATELIYMRARTYDPATAQFLSVDPAVMTTRAPYTYATDNSLNHGDPTGLSNWNPFSESFWTEGNVISESPLNPIPYYEEEVESYENGCGYFASVAHGLEGAVAGAALLAGGEGEDEADVTVADALKGKVGSITKAPLPPGSPSWADIQEMSIADVRAAAKAGEPGYKTILKLLTEGKYNK